MIQLYDSGYIILDRRNETYYTGYSKFDRQLRMAKIYHSKKWATEALANYCNKNELCSEYFALLPVEIRIKA